MSTTTQLSGLASGLDWKTLVSNLIAAERTPETDLRTKQSQFQQQSSALATVNQNLLDLQTAVKALASSDDVYSARTASIAGTGSTWNVSAAPAAATGTYTFSVSQLATQALRQGASDVGAALSSTSDVSGLTIGTLAVATPITEGNFTINGTQISVAKTDSLQDVFNQISTKTGGAVTASYDPITDKVSLSSASEIVVGSANDSSNFLAALQLFNNGTGDIISPKSLGVVSVSAVIANAHLKKPITAVDGSGNGTFKVNGVDIAYNVNSDSIQSVLNKINSSTANVAASFDKASDRFILTNKITGDVGVTVSEASGGLLDSMGLGGSSTFVRGNNAQFTVNGGPTLTSTTNTLDESVTGIAGLTVTANTQTDQTVTVGSDSSGLKSKIQDFIAKFNAVQSFADSSTKITTGSGGAVTTSVLSSNHEVTGIATSLRELAFGTVPGLSGTIQRLQSMGIDFTAGTSQLTVKDSTAFDNALQNNPNDVKTLFSDSSNGLASKFDAYITQTTGSTGIISTQTQSLSKQTTSIDDQVATMERTITADQTRLTNEFVQMESAQSAIQSQLAALTSQFGGSSTTGK